MSNLHEELAYIRDAIDEAFGEGYAKKNPELIGRLVQMGPPIEHIDKKYSNVVIRHRGADERK